MASALVRAAARVIAAFPDAKRLGYEQVEALDGLERAMPKRRVKKVPPPLPGRGRRERRKDATDETARLKAEALKRADGRGELCGYPLGAEDGELCHLDGGSGKRTQEQWIGNVLIEHHRCHQGPGGLDVKPLAWLPQVKAWAARHAYPVPRRFVKLEVLGALRGESGRAA